MTGTWYSLIWQPLDFGTEDSFRQLEACPRFYFSLTEDTNFRGEIEGKYPNLCLISCFKTIIFINLEDGTQLPTHYRYGEFMPGNSPKYDEWLLTQNELNMSILEEIKMREELYKKDIFIQYAAKILRHDMHSGINTYIPRGIAHLRKKISPEQIKKQRLAIAFTLLEDGITHVQRVYKSVNAFTNLTNPQARVLEGTVELGKELSEYLVFAKYKDKVKIEELTTVTGNPYLLCTAFGIFIENGFKFNDNEPEKRFVRVYLFSENEIAIEDNGCGMTQEDLVKFTQPLQTSEKMHNSLLNFNIAIIIIREHKFSIRAEKLENGTRILIRFRNGNG